LEKLSGLQCTDEEIAAWFNVFTRTIERQCLEPEFAAAMTRGKARGHILVRRMQMKLLEEGNATMGIWFGCTHRKGATPTEVGWPPGLPEPACSEVFTNSFQGSNRDRLIYADGAGR
jgi:hypothetical protein